MYLPGQSILGVVISKISSYYAPSTNHNAGSTTRSLFVGSVNKTKESFVLLFQAHHLGSNIPLTFSLVHALLMPYDYPPHK